MISPTFRTDDRRTGLTWDSSRDGLFEQLRFMTEEMDAKTTLTYLATRGDRDALVSLHFANEDGFEWDGLTVVEVDDKGLLDLIIVFDVDDVVGALDELDARAQIVARQNLLGPRTEGPTFENDASRSVDRFVLAAVDNRWDDVIAQLAPSFTLVDTREGSSLELDRDGMLSNSQVLVSLGFVVGDSRREILAVRGESLVLISLRFVTSSDFELEILYLVDVDDDGRFTHAVAYGPESAGAAFAELDERFIATLSDDEGSIVRLGTRLLRVMNGVDAMPGLELLAEDLIYRDLRRGPAEPEVRGLELRGSLAAIHELVDDIRFDVVAIPRLRADGVVAVTRARGPRTTAAWSSSWTCSSRSSRTAASCSASATTGRTSTARSRISTSSPHFPSTRPPRAASRDPQPTLTSSICSQVSPFAHRPPNATRLVFDPEFTVTLSWV